MSDNMLKQPRKKTGGGAKMARQNVLAAGRVRAREMIHETVNKNRKKKGSNKSKGRGGSPSTW